MTRPRLTPSKHASTTAPVLQEASPSNSSVSAMQPSWSHLKIGCRAPRGLQVRPVNTKSAGASPHDHHTVR